MSEPKPSVGRIVHYQAYGTPGGEFPSVPRAAVISEVGPTPGEDRPENAGAMLVGLVVLNPTGLFFNRNVHYSAEPKPGCWSWPPRT